jgi:hypothetical protein
MRKLLGLLVATACVAAFAIGASTVALASGHHRGHARVHSQQRIGLHRVDWGCGEGCGGHPVCDADDPDNDGDDPGGVCASIGSPGADCTDVRLGTFSRVDNALYICLAPKNNTPQADARSQLICETPEDRGGQGGTYIDMDGLDFICLGPSGPQ